MVVRVQGTPNFNNGLQGSAKIRFSKAAVSTLLKAGIRKWATNKFDGNENLLSAGKNGNAPPVIQVPAGRPLTSEPVVVSFTKSSGKWFYDITRQQRRANARTRAKWTKRAAARAFNDSNEALDRIINSPERKSNGKRGVRRGERKKPTYRERMLQARCRKYAENKKGVRVLQWDHNGYPDHAYLLKVGSYEIRIGAAEFKDVGKTPERHQAIRIRELRNEGWQAPVISTFKAFKVWFDSLLRDFRGLTIR